MARVHELGLPLVQVGIRAQCREEAELIRSSPLITTFYAHQIRSNPDWIREVVQALPEKVYITIDADGFDPSVVPCVGTAEPNGLFWNETVELLRQVIESKQVIGVDVVEVAPREDQILSEYTLAKLVYRIIGFLANKAHERTF
jgi:agmatinase